MCTKFLNYTDTVHNMGKTKEGQEARLSRQEVNIHVKLTMFDMYVPSRVHTVALAICIGGGYFVKGVIVSLQPPLYPKEAEAKGATPSQVKMAYAYYL